VSSPSLSLSRFLAFCLLRSAFAPFICFIAVTHFRIVSKIFPSGPQAPAKIEHTRPETRNKGTMGSKNTITSHVKFYPNACA
jgi:hypothetical protein